MPSDLPTRVAAFMAASTDGGERVGPFTCFIDATTANIWRNHAVPDTGATPSADDIAALVAFYERHDRTPRLEYVPAAAPEVEPALVAAGFTVEGRSPLRGCEPGEAIDLPVPDGIAFALATSDADLLDVARMQNIAYGDPAPAGPDDVARLANTNRHGGIVGIARDTVTGEAVGAGLCTGIRAGATELAAVATAASHRRRGIASSLTVMLARTMHERGAALVWLEQEPDLPHRIYDLAGFSIGGEKLWISRPAGAIVAGPVRLHPIGVERARAVIEGDLSDLGGRTPGDGWPHDQTAAGMWMVVNRGAEGWLATLDGAVIGDAGAVTDDGDVMFALTLAPAYRGKGLEATIAAALATVLEARLGTRTVTDATPTSSERRPPRVDAGAARM
jgi:ribosomal protein S18 acetylase RimI-like enzyme